MKHSPHFLKLVESAKKSIREVSCETVEQAIARGKVDFLLIDVREESEWREGHLPGACHLGKGIIERDIEVKCPDFNQTIVLYCGGGFRSALAGEALQKMGYKNVLSMAGGVREWKEKKYLITRS